ncbi:transposase [Streptomyces sp. NBC_01775]|uniref:transposase n=1 Tax=Streptomyces sp. NBC_01775 TaxID=2975939 RepID=UPI002DDB4868|nr:transposase [Streptomyces sp. NBC_01775]WSB76952.1 transposase [Streptomyces sp. NBC_01775]
MGWDDPVRIGRGDDGWSRESFVEEMGLLWEAVGSARMDGRIIGYLIVTDAPYVSSAQLADALKVSAGSISLATRRLTEAGFVKRHAVPGERSRYFRMEDDVWGSFLAGERRFVEEQRQLGEKVLELLGDEEVGPRRRLENMCDYMRWIQGAHRDLLEGWSAYRLAQRPDTEAPYATDAAGTAGTTDAAGPPRHAPGEEQDASALPYGRRRSLALGTALARRLVPDTLWEAAAPLLPSGGDGERAVFTAVVHVLTAGCGWQQLPGYFAVSPATAHRRFTAWSEAGVWEGLRSANGSPDRDPDQEWCEEIVTAALERRHRPGGPRGL